MLTTELLLHRYNGEEIVPTRLPLDRKTLTLADEVMAVFFDNTNKKRLELDEQLLHSRVPKPTTGSSGAWRTC